MVNSKIRRCRRLLPAFALSLAIILCGTGAFAQGSIFGTVTNSDLTTPANGDISFFGFLDDTDEEIRIESSFGAGYDGGNWYDDFQNYLTESPGNPFDFHFHNSANGEGYALSGLIPVQSFFQADINLETVDWPAQPTGLTGQPSSAISIDLNWDAIGGLTYHVYRRMVPSSGSFFRIDDPSGSLANPGVSGDHFVDNGVQVGNSYHYLIIAQDASGNFSPHSDTIRVISEEPEAPVITCPADIEIDCSESAEPENTGFATATDNTDPAPVVTYLDEIIDGDCPFEQIINRTWTATDFDNNSSECVQTITVVDNAAPVITCPDDLTIECGGSIDPANTGTATATDNCDTDPVVTFADVTTGNFITRTWTVVDACDNSSTCDQIITLDAEAPEITCPADITISCDESSDPANTGSATATDNCDATPTITYSDSETAGDCPQELVITRTWTATDDYGSSVSCDQTITVIDDTAPIITCPADLSVDCNASTDPSNTGMATATDNCDASPEITYADVFNENVITRTWTATDNANNSDDCVQTITITDNTAPVITCPDNITIECDESSDPSNTGMATATDNCDSSPTITYDDVVEGNIITRTWTATDDCDNSDACQQVITIEDTTPPVITCPDDITVECDGAIDPSYTGLATAQDNCDASPTVTYSDSEIAGSCAQEKIITRTWTATDESENSSDCVQTITVIDNTAPVITCPNDLTVECDVSTEPSNTGTATATDNCDQSPTISYNDVFEGNVIIRTWTATDACGNASSCDQNITVDDTTPPTITCPTDITVQCDESIDPSNTGMATATDNCDTSPAIAYSDVETAGDCPQERIITRTWTATDNANNSDDCTQTITVVDNTAPVITCPSDVVITFGDPVDPDNTGQASAEDNCDTEPVISYSDEQIENIITRTWTAVDACENSSQCEQVIEITMYGGPIWYVSNDGDDNNDGSPAYPFASIQRAINMSAEGDIVNILDGVYTGPNNRDLDLGGKNITIMSEGGPEVTIIDCEGTKTDPHRGFYFHSGETGDALIMGLTIINGYTKEDGGGILCVNSSPTISRCIFRDNTAARGGAGITCRVSSATISDCDFIDNHAIQFGGAIYLAGSSPDIINCGFINNHAEESGGAILCTNSSPAIDTCNFEGNFAENLGGAICLQDSNPDIEACAFISNNSNRIGGAVYCDGSSPNIVMSVFWRNDALDYGGAIACEYYSMPLITNSTLAENGAANGGGLYCNISSPTLENCIIGFGTSGKAVHCRDDNSDPTFYCSDIFANTGGDWTGCIADMNGIDGNFSADPLFCEMNAGDLQLSGNSLCLADNNECGLLTGALGMGCDIPTDVNDADGKPLPETFILAQNYPNPFNPITTITYALPTRMHVSIAVYNILGQQVDILVDETNDAGWHEIVWDGKNRDGRDVSSGMYLYILRAGDNSLSRKMLLLK